MSPLPIAHGSKRCAIYTRKSTDAGLSLEVNSLVSQREVCQAYIRSQAHRNWLELPHHYDDGGFSGGNLERPALKNLLRDVESGRVDIIVIYKIDRLSRSLTDFVRLIDMLQKHDVSFVSVTQTFDTSDSMGRLVLNILLTFSQFERELASERVRDKHAARKRRGLYTGGTPPFGFSVVKGGKLTIDAERAPVVQELFARYPNESANSLAKELRDRGCLTRRYKTKAGVERGGQQLYFTRILQILQNPIYTGHVVHRGDWIRADVEPLVSREQWELVQQVRLTRMPKRDPVANFLLGILYDDQGRKMRINRGGGGAHGYRCYRSEHALWARGGVCRKVMVEADRVEQLAVSTLRAFLVDRVQLKDTILSLGLYSDDIRRLLKKGGLAARRMEAMDRAQLRAVLLALMPRAEVTTSGLTVHLSCYEISRFLGWDGVGEFQKSRLPPSRLAERIHTIRAPAFLICGHPYFALPIEPCPAAPSEPDARLVELLTKAAEYREYVLANRSRSLCDLAHDKGMGASRFARHLRVNYLAPDIQAAIVDGTQPRGLSSWHILHGPMPLDWEQQRQLMGFGA